MSDAALQLARSHPQRFSEIIERLEEARHSPLNSIQMDTALIRAYAAVKRHYRVTQTEVLYLLTARDAERRGLDALQQQLGHLLVERFGSSFFGDPEPSQGAYNCSVVLLCILVTVGLTLLYSGLV
ncbi:hypothetical protein SLS53_004861 [Cytospora paraplurivora]|uniref:Uncharacterized protein n=1 Tax=Cytospora paraplurivora TaxID=2898453 RepID=A0AAN9U7J8_9PEZI